MSTIYPPETLVRELDGRELRRAFAASIGALLAEAQQVDPDREQRLRETIWDLVHTVTGARCTSASST